MKRLFIFLIISIILATTSASANERVSHLIVNDSMSNPEMIEQWMIPDDAIRLRILANSNHALDQKVKYIVRDRVNMHIHNLVSDIDSLEEARRIIENQVPELKKIVADVLKENEKNYEYDVTFKQDVPFPLKTYGPYLYPAGNYEAILITLGLGEGDNWWCVLFPPLCFIEFFKSSSVAETTEFDAWDSAKEGEGLNSAEEEGDSSEEGEDNADKVSDIEIRFFLFDLFKFS